MRVLVIEDDSTVVQALVRELAKFGFDVREATCSADLPRVLSDFTPNVAIVDLHVGPENGLQIFDRVREHAPRCEAVIVTGSPEAVPATWTAVTLTKPWEPTALLAQLLQRAAPVEPP